MNKPVYWLTFILFGAVFFSTSEQPSGSYPPASIAPMTENPERSYAVKLLNADGLQSLIHQRNGKALLLNIWATWCLPCMEEFPDLNKIAAVYDTGKVEVVGVSLDYADEIQSKVEPFIKKNSVAFKIYLAQFDSQEKFINSIKMSWNGAIPATFIYDRHGKQKLTLIGEQTFAKFKNGIDRVLRSK